MGILRRGEKNFFSFFGPANGKITPKSLVRVFGVEDMRGKMLVEGRTIERVATGSVDERTAPTIMQSRKEKEWPLAFAVANRKPPMPNTLRNVPIIANIRMDPMLRNSDCLCTEKPDSKIIKGSRTKKKVSLLKRSPFESPGILYHINAINILRVTCSKQKGQLSPSFKPTRGRSKSGLQTTLPFLAPNVPATIDSGIARMLNLRRR